jgi:nucleotide sugar dehydrogenase
MQKTKIGFIGQGFIGKNLADNFKDRGFSNIVRYGLEPEYVGNKEKIKECEIIFVAVPTPTTPGGFQIDILKEAISITREGQIIVIKSTVPPDYVRSVWEEFRDRYVLLCPEFLDEATARKDTDHPDHNIIGIPFCSSEWIDKAKLVLEILPEAPYEEIMTYEEASLVKYGHNCFFLFKNMFFNLLFDLVKSYDGDPEIVRKAITQDRRISEVHTFANHKSGRGAGGHCLIKDFSAFRAMFLNKLEKDQKSLDVLSAIEKKNIEYLIKSKKDLDLLEGVYGKIEDIQNNEK